MSLFGMDKEVNLNSPLKALLLVTSLMLARPRNQVNAGSTCRYMGDIAHGKVVPRMSVQSVGGVVRYTCDDGYRLVGEAYRYCTSTGWSGRPAHCQVVNCGDPGTPANGRRFHTDSTYGKSVIYTCNQGFTIKGANTRKCTASGTWSPALPSCERVPCPKLQPPRRGCVTMTKDPVYGDTANYSCNAGTFLVGPAMRTCLSVGQWDGSDPLCNVTMCSRLPHPAHGSVKPDDQRLVKHGTTATFTCDAGFVLNGTATRTCQGTGDRGTWSNNQPTCLRRNCSELAKPVHGEKIGSTYVYQASVRFLCLAGYVIRGAETLTCGADGQWSSPSPTCAACPMSTYKRGSDAVRTCTPCPANSHTAANASSHVQLCKCNHGYKKTGQECIEILCPAHPRPSHGSIKTCVRTVDGQCSFQCQDGYVVSSGSSTRTCQSSGEWSDTPPKCEACPVNTYKTGMVTCSRCWPNSHTLTPGSSTCLCDKGYLTNAQNKSCSDVDECQQNKAGCQQQCINEPGSFRCVCNQPGYKTDPTDPLKCVAKQQCINFDAPENGGLVCIDIPYTNGRKCQVKCNDGFEHPGRVNEWETCGPQTGWKWTFETNGGAVHPCIPEFFPEIRLQTEIFYYTSECHKISEAEKRQIKTAFLNSLEEKGICEVGGKNVCNIESMYISCGTVTDPNEPPGDIQNRRKRSADGNISILKIKFDIVVPETATKNFSCSNQCANASSIACKRACYQKYQNSSINTVNKAVSTINQLLKKNDTAPSAGLKLVIGSRSLTPAKSSLKTAKPAISCSKGKVPHVIQQEGQATRTLCVACQAGTFASSGECVPCRAGTHQPRIQQTRCLPCPPRSTSAPGSPVCRIQNASIRAIIRPNS